MPQFNEGKPKDLNWLELRFQDHGADLSVNVSGLVLQDFGCHLQSSICVEVD
jgi:hypothetical protein